MKKFLSYYDEVRRTALLPGYRGKFHQIFEMLLVFCLRGVGPGYYLMAEMGKTQYDWPYKLGFYNGRHYVRRINQINDPQYYPATFNKIIEKSLLAQNAINSPVMLGHISAACGRSSDGYPLKTSGDFLALLERWGGEKLCFKLVTGAGGAGFMAAEIFYENNEIFLRDIGNFQVYSVGQYHTELGIDRGREVLVEEYFEQHKAVGALNPTSVNTLRVMIYQAAGRRPHCVGAYLRIGRAGSIIDNGSAGGISAKVDLASGTLSAATYADTRAYRFGRHPDTDAPIEGVELPLLPESIALAVKALEVFPGIRYGVFDVAIGHEQPAIIELNARADYVDFSILNIPSRYALH